MTHRSKAGFAIVLAALLFLNAPILCGTALAKAVATAHSCCLKPANELHTAPAACCFKPASPPQSMDAGLASATPSFEGHADAGGALVAPQLNRTYEPLGGPSVSIPDSLFIRFHQLLI